MPRKSRKNISFEEIVLRQRELERERYGAAIAASRGTMPFGHDATEEEQDALWMTMDANLKDDAALFQLTLPQEQGGKGMTPLGASLARWKNRADLMGVGVDTIDEQIAYAEKRTKRCAERNVPVTLDWGPAGPPMQSVEQPQQPHAPQPQPQMPPGGQMPLQPMLPGMEGTSPVGQMPGGMMDTQNGPSGPTPDGGMLLQPPSPGMGGT